MIYLPFELVKVVFEIDSPLVLTEVEIVFLTVYPSVSISVYLSTVPLLVNVTTPFLVLVKPLVSVL